MEVCDARSNTKEVTYGVWRIAYGRALQLFSIQTSPPEKGTSISELSKEKDDDITEPCLTMMTARASIRGEVRIDEPLSQHTTWRVGGRAHEFFRPADRDDLICFLQQRTSDKPIFWLGLGSNLLVRDGGYAGTVISTKGCLDKVWMEGELLMAEAGASCAKVARTEARQGLCGAEFLAGIPGTIGGALAMNAGAFGGETWQQVEWVSTVNKRGDIQKRIPTDYQVSYRQVVGPDSEWFVLAALRLTSGDVAAGQKRIRELLNVRNSKQPIGEPSCGSVFRNPDGDYAARLIEEAGLKGHKLGGAQVSTKHANFIINVDNASANNIEDLIEFVQQEVAAISGVKLKTEVHIVGDRSVLK